MATLLFDIETVGEKWSDIDATTQDVLTHWVRKTAESEAQERALTQDVQNGLGFSPLTGFVVTIGLYDLERAQGVVYYQGDTTKDETIGEYTLKQRSESAMLAEFWEGVQSYDTVVTFNGRQFDVPFLVHRSAIHGIQPSANLMQHRYLRQQHGVRHVDLQDELTFYGAMSKRPNLHLFCRAYGIESPKAAGITGDDVSALYYEGKSREIAEYNIRDVIATTELYKKWLQYFRY